MSNEQLALLQYLQASMFDGNRIVNQDKTLNAKVLFQISKSQDVFACVFKQIPKSIWIKELSVVYYREISLVVNYTEHASTLFYTLKSKEIPFIPLKGITIKDVYPVPEERTMGDVDVLVMQEHYQAACDVLVELGYKQHPSHEESAHHGVFTQVGKPTIELHHALTDYRRQDADYSKFENDIWERSVLGMACGVQAQLMCPTDTLVYMLMHMTSHFLVAGIGLKQILDYGLYIKNYNSEVDWNQFKEQCLHFNLDGLANAVAGILKEHFNFAVPLIEGNYAPNAASELLNDIWTSGNLGKESIGQATGSMFLKDPDQANHSSTVAQTKILIRYFKLELDKMFPSASKNILLLPLLYMVFFIRRIGSKGGGGLGSLIYAFKSVKESKRRYELAKLMKLRRN